MECTRRRRSPKLSTSPRSTPQMERPWARRPRVCTGAACLPSSRSEEHTSELQSLRHLVCRLLLENKNSFRIAALYAAFDGWAGVEVGWLTVGAAAGVPFFFNDAATTEIYTLSLHDALPISRRARTRSPGSAPCTCTRKISF